MKKADKNATRIVRREFNPAARLTKDQLQQLDALDALPDDQIDTSDIPELPESVWRERGIRRMFYRPVKRPVTMRLDADVIEWLKSKAGPEGKGYQTTANQLLRAKMIAELRAAVKSPAAKKIVSAGGSK
ncbi:uncharacterized protein (DUF4415 family) [Silvibacterium bohemicum]|uniref:Uncharacterized protein (DUF4415 family) n=1 Tax=Silvibacterium bohemicum TaxID=1577686 RepID=A0A841JME9_9BACT|nr:BrnA antitoxin family protein [Silvibacterium bohemicum]MBB6142526.1 uncharacterized protein (DUF4415 family) [Silvibacterium bohemicum]